MGSLCVWFKKGRQRQVHLGVVVCVVLWVLGHIGDSAGASDPDEPKVEAEVETLATTPAVLSESSEDQRLESEAKSGEEESVSHEIRIVSAPVVEGGQGHSFSGTLTDRLSNPSPQEGLELTGRDQVKGLSPGTQTDQSQRLNFSGPDASERAQVFTGPDRPVGHSLGSPEAQKRITALLAERLREGTVSDSSAFVPDNLPPLVDGQYGFAKPIDMESGAPTAILQLGSRTGRTAVVVEKLHHRLSVFRSNEKGHLQLVKTFRAITGKDPGDKEARGDLRTPEGIYFVNGRLEDQELPAKYGRLALTLNYPNLFDQRLKKSGYGIWIHATDDPRRLQFPFDTEGCIAVSNEDVVELESYIVPELTPIIITKEMTTAEPEALDEPKQGVLRMLDSWRVAWTSSDLEQYIEYYSEDFRFKNMNKNAWKEFKSRLSQERQRIEVRISEPDVFAFENQMIVRFYQKYSSEGHTDFGRKTLHLQWENNRYRIISETWSPVQKTETALQEVQPHSRPL